MEFTFDGIKIYYSDEGSGKPVVFFHGWGADTRSFEICAKALEGCRIIRLDFPGHGKSEEPQRAYSLDDFADCAKKLFEVTGVKNPVLVGHSNGGRVIIRLLSGGYEAKKAVLIDSAGIIPKRSLSYKIKVAKYKAAKKAVRIFFPKTADERIEKMKKKSGSADYKNASGVMRDTMVKLVNTDLAPELQKIKVPTLLVWGTQDKETPFSDAKLMESLIPDSGIVELTGGSHWAFVEQSGKFIAALKSFL